MKTEMKPLKEIIPYARNPRDNQGAVSAVAASIKEFGFQQPLVIDTENVIIAGHTRYLAAQALGLTEVPVVIARGLTPAQIKAYRILDNKTGEKAKWDFELLQLELLDIDRDNEAFREAFDQSELDVIMQADWKPQAVTDDAPHTGTDNPVKPIFVEADERAVIEKAIARCREEAQDELLSEGKSVAMICDLYLKGEQ